MNGRKKTPFSAAFLAKQKQALIDERAVYLHQAEAFEAEADSLIADFEPGDVQFDEESGEGDTLSIERERDLALSAQARAALEQIDHALAKFDLGTYGICEVSGDPIPKERLEAIPWAKERVEYKAASFTSPSIPRPEAVPPLGGPGAAGRKIRPCRGRSRPTTPRREVWTSPVQRRPPRSSRPAVPIGLVARAATCSWCSSASRCSSPTSSARGGR